MMIHEASRMLFMSDYIFYDKFAFALFSTDFLIEHYPCVIYILSFSILNILIVNLMNNNLIIYNLIVNCKSLSKLNSQNYVNNH